MPVAQQRALFWEGYAAQLEGVGKVNSPYNSEADEYTYWIQGYDAAWVDVRKSSLV